MPRLDAADAARIAHVNRSILQEEIRFCENKAGGVNGTNHGAREWLLAEEHRKKGPSEVAKGDRRSSRNWISCSRA